MVGGPCAHRALAGDALEFLEQLPLHGWQHAGEKGLGLARRAPKRHRERPAQGAAFGGHGYDVVVLGQRSNPADIRGGDRKAHAAIGLPSPIQLVNAGAAQEAHRASGPCRERLRAGPGDLANDRHPFSPRRPVLQRGEHVLGAHRHLALADGTGFRCVHKFLVHRQRASVVPWLDSKRSARVRQ
jgi:hypothetical protein